VRSGNSESTALRCGANDDHASQTAGLEEPAHHDHTPFEVRAFGAPHLVYELASVIGFKPLRQLM
jgi:hypothetical protein